MSSVYSSKVSGGGPYDGSIFLRGLEVTGAVTCQNVLIAGSVSGSGTLTIAGTCFLRGTLSDDVALNISDGAKLVVTMPTPISNLRLDVSGLEYISISGLATEALGLTQTQYQNMNVRALEVINMVTAEEKTQFDNLLPATVERRDITVDPLVSQTSEEITTLVLEHGAVLHTNVASYLDQHLQLRPPVDDNLEESVITIQLSASSRFRQPLLVPREVKLIIEVSGDVTPPVLLVEDLTVEGTLNVRGVALRTLQLTVGDDADIRGENLASMEPNLYAYLSQTYQSQTSIWSATIADVVDTRSYVHISGTSGDFATRTQPLPPCDYLEVTDLAHNSDLDHIRSLWTHTRSGERNTTTTRVKHDHHELPLYPQLVLLRADRSTPIDLDRTDAQRTAGSNDEPTYGVLSGDAYSLRDDQAITLQQLLPGEYVGDVVSGRMVLVEGINDPPDFERARRTTTITDDQILEGDLLYGTPLDPDQETIVATSIGTITGATPASHALVLEFARIRVTVPENSVAYYNDSTLANRYNDTIEELGEIVLGPSEMQANLPADPFLHRETRTRVGETKVDIVYGFSENTPPYRQAVPHFAIGDTSYHPQQMDFYIDSDKVFDNVLLTTTTNGQYEITNGVVTYTAAASASGTDTIHFETNDTTTERKTLYQVSITVVDSTVRTIKMDQISMPVFVEAIDATFPVARLQINSRMTYQFVGETPLREADAQQLVLGFEVHMTDGTHEGREPLTVIVNVQNGEPTCIDDFVTLTQGETTVSGNVLTNDSDPEGGELTIVDGSLNQSNCTHGSVTLATNGEFTYTLNTGAVYAPGTLELFQFRVTDGTNEVTSRCIVELGAGASRTVTIDPSKLVVQVMATRPYEDMTIISAEPGAAHVAGVPVDGTFALTTDGTTSVATPGTASVNVRFTPREDTEFQSSDFTHTATVLPVDTQLQIVRIPDMPSGNSIETHPFRLVSYAAHDNSIVLSQGQLSYVITDSEGVSEGVDQNPASVGTYPITLTFTPSNTTYTPASATGTLNIVQRSIAAAVEASVVRSGSIYYEEGDTPNVLTVPAIAGFTISNYQWLRNGADIDGATEAAYAITQADIGKFISLRYTVENENSRETTQQFVLQGTLPTRTVDDIIHTLNTDFSTNLEAHVLTSIGTPPGVWVDAIDDDVTVNKLQEAYQHQLVNYTLSNGTSTESGTFHIHVAGPLNVTIADFSKSKQHNDHRDLLSPPGILTSPFYDASMFTLTKVVTPDSDFDNTADIETTMPDLLQGDDITTTVAVDYHLTDRIGREMSVLNVTVTINDSTIVRAGASEQQARAAISQVLDKTRRMVTRRNGQASEALKRSEGKRAMRRLLTSMGNTVVTGLSRGVLTDLFGSEAQAQKRYPRSGTVIRVEPVVETIDENDPVASIVANSYFPLTVGLKARRRIGSGADDPMVLMERKLDNGVEKTEFQIGDTTVVVADDELFTYPHDRKTHVWRAGGAMYLGDIEAPTLQTSTDFAKVSDTITFSGSGETSGNTVTLTYTVGSTTKTKTTTVNAQLAWSIDVNDWSGEGEYTVTATQSEPLDSGDTIVSPASSPVTVHLVDFKFVDNSIQVRDVRTNNAFTLASMVLPAGASAQWKRDDVNYGNSGTTALSVTQLTLDNMESKAGTYTLNITYNETTFSQSLLLGIVGVPETTERDADTPALRIAEPRAQVSTVTWSPAAGVSGNKLDGFTFDQPGSYSAGVVFAFAGVAGSSVTVGPMEVTLASVGDPYVTPLYGPAVKLPDRAACYRLFQDEHTVINARVESLGPAHDALVRIYFQGRLQKGHAPVVQGFFYTGFWVRYRGATTFIDVSSYGSLSTRGDGSGRIRLEGARRSRDRGSVCGGDARMTHTFRFGPHTFHVHMYDNPQIHVGVGFASTENLARPTTCGVLITGGAALRSCVVRHLRSASLSSRRRLRRSSVRARARAASTPTRTLALPGEHWYTVKMSSA